MRTDIKITFIGYTVRAITVKDADDHTNKGVIMIKLNASDVISTSHHIVSFKDGKVYKKPRNDSPTALAEIQQDYEYLTLIGYEVEFEDNTLVMPFIGQPLDSIEPNMEKLLESIDKAQKHLPLPKNSGKIGKDISKITKEKIRERLAENDYDLRKRTKESMKMAKRILNKRTPIVIAHTDSHSKNFLKDDKGDIHLIDWESSVAGLPEFDLAVLYIYLLTESIEGIITEEQSENAYRNHIRPRIVDQEAFDAFFVFKLIRHLSWTYVLGDMDIGERFIKIINETMAPYIKDREYKKQSKIIEKAFVAV